MVSMKDAIIDFFKRYAKFKGKSTRAAFWWVQLFNFIILTIFVITLSIIAVNVGAGWQVWTSLIITILVFLALIIPSIALTFRRYQDAGLSLNGALIFYVLEILLWSFAFINGFLQTLAIIVIICSYCLLILPSDFLVGKFGKLTRSE